MSIRSMKRQSSAGSFFADEALTEAAVLAIRHETNSAVNSRSVLHTGEPPVTWKDYLPKVTTPTWINYYRHSDDPVSLLVGDASAGLVIAVFLIPQAMAYAQLAGVDPINGLYSAIFALLVYPWFATSPQLSVGPVAVVSLLSNSAIAFLVDGDAADAPARFLRLSMTLALMSGVIQLILGALRAGFLINFLSHPVLKGFTSAAAIIIGCSQLGRMFKVETGHSHYPAVILYEFFSHIGDAHVVTVVLAVENVLLFVLINWLKSVALKRYPEAKHANKFKRTLISSVPTALIVVLFNIAIVDIWSLHEEGVAIVGDIATGLPTPFEVFTSGTGVDDSWFDDIELLFLPALVMSLVGFLEAVTIAKAMNVKYQDAPIDVDPNQELYAIGVANLASAFFSGVPVTGGFVRTPVNGNAGARTPLSSVITAVLLLITALVATPLFKHLPQVTLAATIVVAVTNLLDFKTPLLLWHVSMSDLIVLVTAFLGTLLLGIEEGVMLACVLSLAVVIKRTTTPHWAVLGRLSGTNMWNNLRRFRDARTVRGIAVVRFDAQLFFANTAAFQKLVMDAARDVSRQGEPPYLRHFSAQDEARHSATHLTRKLTAHHVTGEGDTHHALHENEAGGHRHGEHNDCGQRVLHGVEVSAFPRGTRHVVVDMSAVSSVDYSAMHMLADIPVDLARAGLSNVKVWLCNVRGPVRDSIRAILRRLQHSAQHVHSRRLDPAHTPVSSISATSDDPVVVTVTPGGSSVHHARLENRLFCMAVHESVQWLLCQHPEHRHARHSSIPTLPDGGNDVPSLDDVDATAAHKSIRDAPRIVINVGSTKVRIPSDMRTPIDSGSAHSGDGSTAARTDHGAARAEAEEHSDQAGAATDGADRTTGGDGGGGDASADEAGSGGGAGDSAPRPTSVVDDPAGVHGASTAAGGAGAGQEAGEDGDAASAADVDVSMDPRK